MHAVVINQRSYSFEDKQERGRMVEGLTLSCIVESNEGYQVVELPAPYAIREKFGVLPALFDLVTEIVPKGKVAVMRVADARRLNDVGLGGLFAAKAEKVPA